jgi:hypothetical protein
VQGYQEKVCGSPCPAGQGSADDGRCLPNSIITNLAKKSVRLASTANPSVQRLDRNDSNDLVNSVAARPGIEDNTVTPAPIAEQYRHLQDDRARLAAVAPAPQVASAPTKPKEHPAQTENPRTPVPTVGVYDHRSRPRSPPRQADLMRSFFRTFQRTLAQWGIR